MAILSCTCIILVAVGKSKKIAKRAAASKLLQSVRQLQNDTTNTAILDDEEDELPLVSYQLKFNCFLMTFHSFL